MRNPRPHEEATHHVQAFQSNDPATARLTVSHPSPGTRNVKSPGDSNSLVDKVPQSFMSSQLRP